MGPGFSLYDILGVSSTATQEEIKAAYRASVLKYHPDVNKAPNAQRLTEMLNSAHEVLGDPAKRRAYDAQLESGSAPSASASESQEVWDLLTCDGCGKVSAQLRFANFFRVWSIIVYTQMRGIGGVLCPECRSKRATSSAVFSAFLGPWGFPWGIFYTLRAFIAAARGGEFPRLENAQLLRHQAVAFLQRNYLSEALTNFTDSLRFEKNEHVSTLLKESIFTGIVPLPKTRWLRGQTIGLGAVLIPLLLLAVLFAWAGTTGSSSAASADAPNSAQAVVESAAPAPEETRPPFRDACLKSTRAVDAKIIYDACKKLRVFLANRRASASEQSDKDDFTVLGAMAEYQEAVAAQRLGYQHEAEKEGDESVTTFGIMKDSAADPDAKKAALQFYNCYKLSECGK